MGAIYFKVGDPAATTRTWQYVLEELARTKCGSNGARWRTAIKDRAFDSIRSRPLLETTAEDFLKVLNKGTVSTNVFLRRVHNFALDLAWLPVAVLPKRQWPQVRHKEHRAITLKEHQQILAREFNPERKAFYELLWHVGASQGDLAALVPSDLDWTERTISFSRKKTGTPVVIRFGEEGAKVLRTLPQEGPLFPYLCSVRASDRATEFKQRCNGLKIEGITLHSYRYAWAERAKVCGLPERFAQQALGHNSKAIARAYSRKAEVKVPALEDLEREAEKKIVEMKAA